MCSPGKGKMHPRITYNTLSCESLLSVCGEILVLPRVILQTVQNVKSDMSSLNVEDPVVDTERFHLSCAQVAAVKDV